MQKLREVGKEWRYLSEVNVCQKAHITEEILTQKEDKMTWPLDLSQSSWLVTLGLTGWGHEQSGHGGRDRPHSRDSIYQGWSIDCCLWTSNLSAVKTNVEPLIWHYFSRRPNSHLVASQQFWASCLLERPDRCLLWVSVCFSCLQRLSQHCFPGAYRTFDLWAWHPIQHSIRYGTHFTVMELWGWDYDHEIHWLYHFTSFTI